MHRRYCDIDLFEYEDEEFIPLSNLQIPVDDQKALDKWFGECLTELEAKATGDFEQLSEKVVECTKEMAGIGMSTISTSDETEATEATSTDSDNGDRENQVQIPWQQNSSSQMSWAQFYLLKNVMCIYHRSARMHFKYNKIFREQWNAEIIHFPSQSTARQTVAPGIVRITVTHSPLPLRGCTIGLE